MDSTSSNKRADADLSTCKTKDDKANETQNTNVTHDTKDQELEMLMLTCKRTEAKGDVNLFENMFQSWKNQEKQTEATEKELKQKLEICERDKEAAVRKVNDLENTVDLLQTAVQSLHNDVDLVDKFGKENIELKNGVKEMEEQLSKQKEIFKQKCKDLDNQIKDKEKKYEKHINELQNEMESQLNEKINSMSKLRAEKEQEIGKLSREMQLEKEKLTVEYENKLVKLQRQKATVSMNQQQSSSANQEIFRKKLQHLKKEHETEVNILKEQIKSLQEQLNVCKSTQQGGAQNRLSFSTQPLFKKTRRF